MFGILTGVLFGLNCIFFVGYKLFPLLFVGMNLAFSNMNFPCAFSANITLSGRVLLACFFPSLIYSKAGHYLNFL